MSLGTGKRRAGQCGALACVPFMFQFVCMVESPPPKMPTRRRMTLHAISVVEATRQDAQDGPVAMSPAIRLALGWLLFDRVAEYWQAQEFMHRLRNPPDPANGAQADYCRRRDLSIYVEAWRREVRRRDSESRNTASG